MNLTLHGHEDRYAVEQLQLALFPEGTEGEAISKLHRGKTWLTATTKITVDGKTVTGVRRMKAAAESVRERRRTLQQSYYKAAVQLLPAEPAWGALAGVRPTKISTKHMLSGGSEKSAAKLLKENGATKVYAAVTHCLLNEVGQKKLLEAPEIEALVTTDAVPQTSDLGGKLKVVSIAPLLGEAIRRIHDGKSVSSLFYINH